MGVLEFDPNNRIDNFARLKAALADDHREPLTAYLQRLLEQIGISGEPGADGAPGPVGPPGPPGPAGPPGGDMFRSVYDSNLDGVVDYADAAPWTGISGKPTTFPPDATAELIIRKGVANGYPSLDATGKVPVSQLPAGGGGGGTVVQVWGETPVGAINGANVNYTSANPYRSGVLAVYLNGLRLRPSSDYTETGSQSFRLITAPLAGDSLSIDYVQP